MLPTVGHVSRAVVIKVLHDPEHWTASISLLIAFAQFVFAFIAVKAAVQFSLDSHIVWSAKYIRSTFLSVSCIGHNINNSFGAKHISKLLNYCLLHVIIATQYCLICLHDLSACGRCPRKSRCIKQCSNVCVSTS